MIFVSVCEEQNRDLWFLELYNLLYMSALW
jgi:hypothetical protein